mgnify:FL=1
MNNIKTAVGVIIGSLFFLTSAGLQAMPSYCNSIDGINDNRTPTAGTTDDENGWTDPGPQTTSDMTFRTEKADNCYGVVATQGGENDDAGSMDDIWDGTWTLLAKDEGSADTGTIDGVTFTLSADAAGGNVTDGTWTLSREESGTPGLPITLDIAGVLKASPCYATYLFLEQTFTSDPLTGEGDFEITFNNNGGNLPGLSHLSLYYREVSSSSTSSSTSSTTSGPPQEISEPGLLALLGAGLLGSLLFRRRTRVQLQA